METRAKSASFAIVLVLLGGAISIRTGHAETVLFYGSPFDLAIPADPEGTKGWMDDAIIEVPDHFIITDLDVSVSLTHTKVFDLRLSLTSPSGTTVLLNSYDPFTGYFEGEDYQQTVFDDEAAVSISGDCRLVSCRARWITAFSISGTRVCFAPRCAEFCGFVPVGAPKRAPLFVSRT